ncbi:MAG TPA: HK97 family phage prohead protease [Vicinamibacterales bacterium]|jgi:HK97 family phage prohead protease|nr:HK97 family phage prohead protease [Vicinamibacterales bacterium]
MTTITDAKRKRFDVIVGRAAGTSSDARLTITTQHEDREGDVLIPEGAILDAYRENPIVLFSHDHYSIPVGRTTSLDVIPGRGIRADFVWLKNDPDADRVRNAFEQGVLNAASVGFRPLAWDPLGTGGYRYTKWELLEWSIVSVPANPHATRLVKSLSIYHPDESVVAVEFTDDSDEEVAVEFVGEAPDPTPGHILVPDISAKQLTQAITDAVVEEIRKVTGQVD